tara:strand:+ start:185 stop:409 length:225 start_codon:yes stop_codon:yes gene_type:complete
MKFTLKQYLHNEDINYHSENALELVKIYGTKKELEEIQKIYDNHMERGHILSEEMDKRYKISNKYYEKLVRDNI